MSTTSRVRGGGGEARGEAVVDQDDETEAAESAAAAAAENGGGGDEKENDDDVEVVVEKEEEKEDVVEVEGGYAAAVDGGVSAVAERLLRFGALVVIGISDSVSDESTGRADEMVEADDDIFEADDDPSSSSMAPHPPAAPWWSLLRTLEKLSILERALLTRSSRIGKSVVRLVFSKGICSIFLIR